MSLVAVAILNGLLAAVVVAVLAAVMARPHLRRRPARLVLLPSREKRLNRAA